MKAYLGYVRKQAGKYGVKGSRLADLHKVLGEFLEWTTFTDHKSGQQYFYNVLGRKFQTTITVKEMKYSLEKLDAEYGERARKAEANEGVDWKALSHALRGGLQLQEIYSSGDLKYPLAQATLIKKIKAGELPFKEVQDILETTVDAVERLAHQAEKNGLPNGNVMVKDDVVSIIGRFEKRGDQLFFTPLQEKFNA